MDVPLCRSCILVANLPAEKTRVVEQPFECPHCFGILSDDQLRQEIAAHVREEFAKGEFDGDTFILAINIPISMFLRQAVFGRLMGDSWNTREMSPKNLFANLLLKDIEKACPARGSLTSDLELTITLEQEEFASSDTDFLLAHFPRQLLNNRKRQAGELDLNSLCTKVKINEIQSSMTDEIAKKYRLASPSKRCTFSISFQREAIYVAGRYCKDSRSLPQSPWTADSNIPPRPGHSVSEKIAGVMKRWCEADDTRFVASGREDVDVKLINARKAGVFKKEQLERTLADIRAEINRDPEVSVSELVRATSQKVEELKRRRRRTPPSATRRSLLTDGMLERLNAAAPVMITQPTVVRVLKRRPLHDRPREIYTMKATRVDQFHFQLEVSTQAGTYIKEFVHGDFGRTVPSVGTLMGLEAEQADILELDVVDVDLEWPKMRVLMVAEKPILAESIAKLLSNNSCHTRKGKNGVCSVSEYTGTFQNQRAEFKVTSTCGHVETVDFPARYNNWDRTDPAELLVCPIEKQEANPKMRMIDYLHGEAKGVDVLVLWLDNDKEGENICPGSFPLTHFEVINACKGAMNKPRSGSVMDVVYRAHFSAISAAEIKKAMNNLGRPNLNESRSVDARQELDLRIGCSFTRFQTRYFQHKYGDLDSTCISYGPCQTPTLAFCVQRHDQITGFTPEPYYVLKVEADGGGRSLKLDAADHLLVDDLSSKEGRKEKPVALNTVELLRVGSSSLGISPAQTMHTAEHLYTRGYISYPRTETTAYPKDFDFHSILQQQEGGRFREIVKKVGAYIAGFFLIESIYADKISNPKGGEDKGDHPPITPQRAPDGSL
ncbi:DNA topoisomerase [Aphelenchoides fujianensis]|nr:DNA topoisomerase [Aphelenchoides fujianensis]